MNIKSHDSRATEELIRLALTEEDEGAAWELVTVLQFRGNREVFEAAQKLCESNNPKERKLSTDIFGQLGILGISCQEKAVAISTLIELSSDEDEDVRNWATFGLGSQIDTDTVEIREALLQRLVDENHEIRGEALVGLAKKRDERVLEPLIKELSSDSVGILAVEAAKEIEDARLSSVLRQLKRWNIDKNLLAEAINSCDK